ncbi:MULTISPECIES: OsmC family protein [unclassified Janthinobacterium]|uniref:OsmC family protein n=1 Tax=unclassified Janthinobacterium TaxID=2610881 RepID=UPI00160FB556|nr:MULTISPECIES: OsmC family protein [unclassified Janthinobacterium]MBB5610245.1 osmotically inducible protein OsmC [Janthinobacterium sp. S3T4]MBB5615613.1 osmotically inducible protein OsmC [Janthinobacterium sp. S3M3]
MKKTGSAVWSGGLKDGKGFISTQSGALDNVAYGFNTRFEDGPGSNPEELIGAAHAACFTMALSGQLDEAGLRASALKTTAEVTLEKIDGSYAITAVHLRLTASIPGASDAVFQDVALRAKLGCPVSKLLATEVTLDAHLE